MPKQRASTEGDFNELLAWLHPNAENAAVIYETIRKDLIKIFYWRGCSDPEGMADETIVRVTRKVAEIAGSYSGAPKLYFYGVAKHLLQEYQRKRDTSLPAKSEQVVLPTASTKEEEDHKERVHECFERCLKKLKAPERKLILQYHQGEKRARIERRKRMATELGIDVNALRVRARRIRATLRKCIEECLAPGTPMT